MNSQFCQFSDIFALHYNWTYKMNDSESWVLNYCHFVKFKYSAIPWRQGTELTIK